MRSDGSHVLLLGASTADDRVLSQICSLPRCRLASARAKARQQHCAQGLRPSFEFRQTLQLWDDRGHVLQRRLTSPAARQGMWLADAASPTAFRRSACDTRLRTGRGARSRSGERCLSRPQQTMREADPCAPVRTLCLAGPPGVSCRGMSGSGAEGFGSKPRRVPQEQPDQTRHGRFQHGAERSTYTPRHRPAVCGAATSLNRHARHLVTSPHCQAPRHRSYRNCRSLDSRGGRRILAVFARMQLHRREAV